MSHPQDLPLRVQAGLIAAGELGAADLLAATLGRIGERNGALNAVVATFPEQSAQMLSNAPAGPLHGVPITVKDMFSLPWRGFRSGTNHEMQPASASAVFRRLRDAGAIVVGVDNQHELGIGTTGIVSAYGPAGNPWNPAHCAGGSSGGSAAAVGARLVGGAVGSDSGGSTRLPAGWCGVVGLKLTYRSLPYDGYSGLNSTMSAPGVFGRDAADARLLAEVLLGRPLPTAVGKSLRVGVVRRPFWDDIDAEVEAACQGVLAAAGWEVVEIEIPHSDLAAPAGAVRAASELVLVVPPAVVSDVSALTRGMVQYVALQPATRLLRADRARAALRRDLVAAFTRCDVLAWPTNPAPAPPIATPVVELPSGTSLPDAPNMRQAVLANLTGVPGISVPVGVHSSGLPMGLQLLAGWGQESVLLDAAGWVEEASDRRWVDAIPTP